MIPEDTLDFHDTGPLTEEQIRLQTETFLENSLQSGLECVLIITGKGTHSGSRGLAKRTVREVLRKNKLKLEYKNADYNMGGDGAIIIRFI